ncbi:MAG: GNAT family N-acetyltransferase [Deltaproteobacteria bacterium]|nr:GNAT family N-acetyltransferase [Deltaproteobacteria bacterium]
MIVGLEGGVERRADHDILRWPALPMAAEGNMLVYDRPPEPSDLPAWEASFRRAMALWPDVRHLAFGWGGRPPDDAGMVALEARGYRLETVSVRLAEALALAPPAPVGIRVRPLQSRAEWGLAVDLQLDATPEGETLPDYADFAQARMERCAALCQRGFGFWLGAFEGPRLAGCLGVFARRGLGRYQMVVTGSAFRRRGVAGHLVGAAATRAIRTLGARRLVICAEPGSPADALYGRLGFRPVAPMHRAIRCADD